MSVQKLLTIGEKSIGYTYSDEPIYVVNPSSYKESVYSCTPPTLQLGSGTQTQCDIQHPRSDLYEMQELTLRFNAVNASATESVTVYNKLALLKSFKMTVNGQEIVYHQDMYSVLACMRDTLEKVEAPDVYTELAKHRNEITTTFNGDTFPVSSTSSHEINLFVLVPELKNYIVNMGINRIFVDVTFQSNTNSLLNNQFCKSNTTTNCYGNNITFTNLSIVAKYVKHSDARMYKQMSPLLIHSRHLSKVIPNISWQSVGVDSHVINLYNDYTKLRRITGLSVYFWDNVANSAFNSAGACKFFSGPEYYSFLIRQGSDILVDLSQTTSDLNGRRKYFLKQFKERTGGHEMPLEWLNKSTPFADYYYQYEFDLTNIKEDDQTRALALSGRSNDSNDFEITLTCAQSISANVNMYAVLHYNEIGKVDPANGSYIKLQ